MCPQPLKIASLTFVLSARQAWHGGCFRSLPISIIGPGVLKVRWSSDSFSLVVFLLVRIVDRPAAPNFNLNIHSWS